MVYKQGRSQELSLVGAEITSVVRQCGGRRWCAAAGSGSAAVVCQCVVVCGEERDKLFT